METPVTVGHQAWRAQGSSFHYWTVLRPSWGSSFFHFFPSVSESVSCMLEVG